MNRQRHQPGAAVMGGIVQAAEFGKLIKGLMVG